MNEIRGNEPPSCSYSPYSMKSAQFIIIGGGVVGASVAFHLTERGAKDVLILEREGVQGLGSTGAATGGIRSQFETEINIQMSQYSLDHFQKWDRDCGYEPRGYLFFATTAEQFEYLRQNVERQKALGVRDVEIVDVDSIRRLIPGMNCDDVVGGSFGATDGFIDPVAVMNSFTDAATKNGARVQLGTRATAIVTNSDKVCAVDTDRGRIDCDNVIICTGAWARELAATTGVDLPVEPMRRQIVWTRSKEPLPANLPMVIDLGTGFHFRPVSQRQPSIGAGSVNELMFAYPDPEERPSFSRELDDKVIEKIREKARHRAPWLFETEVVREKCRVGLYENTPDHHAILGGCDVGGLYFANGFSGHGVMHSPATGRALAEIILDGRSSFLDVSMLSLDRFASGDLLHETAFI